jgi:Zn-dependent protease
LSPTVGIYTVTLMEAAVPLLQKIVLLALPILIAVVLHELAHGYVAYRLGDPTAAHAGRLTLNPIAHVDPFGTVILPAILLFSGSPFLFGYAKPVPVNFMNLHKPRRDMVLVALAGPLTNILLAGIAAVVLKTLFSPAFVESGISTMLFQLASSCLLINVSLAVFNMLPVPPLDGGRVATGLLPRTPALALARLEPYGMLIILLLMTSGVLDDILRPMRAFLIYTLL